MYNLQLQESLFPAQFDQDLIEETVADALRRVTGARPDGPALVEVTLEGETARRWTYSGLLADVERLAEALATRFAKGERVAVWSPNSPEWVMMEFACAMAGLTLVTVNPGFQARELKYVLEQSYSAGLFLVDEFRGNPMGRTGREVAAELPGIREVCFMEEHEQLFATGPRTHGIPEVSPHDPFMIQYTSGTTGFPKGAVLSHYSVINNALLFKNRTGALDGSRWVNFMPQFHTGGSGCTTLGCLQSFGCQYICRLFAPVPILQLLSREQGHSVTGVPTMLLALCEVQDQLQLDMSSVRMAVSGGAMVAPELVRRVRETFGCDFQIIYGQTETSPVLTQSQLGDSLEDIAYTVGQPLPHTAISIRDPQTHQVVPCGTVGEICAKGYCQMISYHDNPEATAATVDAQGWLHTGDLGTMDRRGFVAVTGRVKEMIIRGGENLFPAEIENTLIEHPSVAEVAVVGLPDERWGEIVGCFVRLRADAKLDIDELNAFCRERLAAQKAPTVWVQVEDFPLTGSGKVQKFLIRDRFEKGEYAPES